MPLIDKLYFILFLFFFFLYFFFAKVCAFNAQQLAERSVTLWEVTTAHFDKVAFLKRNQCESCSMIIYLIALYDYDFKYTAGRYIEYIF